jgi:cytochrome c-type biogenesis protein CcmH
MTLFIGLAMTALLIIFTLALWPLWRMQRGLAACLLLACVLLSSALYRQFGKPSAIGYTPPVAESVSIDQALAELKAVVAKQPENLEARLLLARSLIALNKPVEAQPHFKAAHRQQPGNAGLMIDYAESLFRGSPPNRPNTEALALIDKALALEPENSRAGFFKGILQLQAGKPADAAKTWEALLPKLDSATAQALLPQINRARQDAGLPTMALPEVASIDVTVVLGDGLQAQMPPGAVLFVFAKKSDGNGPPIAAKRVAISDFPMQLQLSDADSIMPTATLFSQNTFTLHARISASGMAEQSSGDWQATPVTVQSDTLGPVTLTLQRQP